MKKLIFAVITVAVAVAIPIGFIGCGGDEKPNTMADLIGDVYGAIAHIQEHAKEYGGAQ